MEQPLAQARFNMIHQQVQPWGVLDDRVLGALERVPRERFVPDAYLSLAYADIEIPIAGGEHMLPPKLVGRALQAVAVKPGDRVLEIGTGTGYVAACLAHLGARVLSLEIVPALAGDAQARLAALELDQVDVRVGDGLAERVGGGPFDAIVLTGSLPVADDLEIFQPQLAQGGRLFAVVGTAPAMEAVLVTRVGGADFRRESLFETCIEPLANALEPTRFVF